MTLLLAAFVAKSGNFQQRNCIAGVYGKQKRNKETVASMTRNICMVLNVVVFLLGSTEGTSQAMLEEACMFRP
jgi:hypothetical protein